jgi:hypothetical protein
MRQFYEAYGSNRKVSPPVRQLPWTHHLIILSQANGTPLARGQREHGELSSPKPPQACEVAAVLRLVDSTNRRLSIASASA